MGTQERERKVYRALRRAGLDVIPDAVPAGTIPFAGGYGVEDVTGGFSHPYATPRLVERLNADWYDLAVSSGLLDHRREFLVMLPQGTRSHRAAQEHLHSGSDAPMLWTRVRLLDRWDIMGRGAASAFLGVRAGHPAFAMMALDSSVYIVASTGEAGVDVFAVGHPDRSENILRRMEQIVLDDSPYDHPQGKWQIAVWLKGRGGSTAALSDR
ncbi:hypothetical protein [Streptomyces mangrovisoli]|uniref:Uncharacterized protein n=1 Tax=Streptomyces mangrovisoli TaxID=1428628 RepID=A0A1J4NQZ8_9ACTN|nr:hypothetical protein [Streptomyces mangrovisoli]OIJ63574.1 hypothetical protein WN71_032620 [Streptomyces mangrovisoli]